MVNALISTCEIFERGGESLPLAPTGVVSTSSTTPFSATPSPKGRCAPLKSPPIPFIETCYTQNRQNPPNRVHHAIRKRSTIHANYIKQENTRVSCFAREAIIHAKSTRREKTRALAHFQESDNTRGFNNYQRFACNRFLRKKQSYTRNRQNPPNRVYATYSPFQKLHAFLIHFLIPRVFHKKI